MEVQVAKEDAVWIFPPGIGRIDAIWFEVLR